MKAFVDTSAFYALASKTDEAHARAYAIHEGLKRDGVVLMTTNYVLLEAVALLQRRHGTAEAGSFGDFVMERVELIWIDATQHRTAWKLWKERGRRNLSLVDCSCFVVMRELNIRHAFAFDDQFREAGFVLLSEPADRVAERRAGYRVRTTRR